MADAVFPTQETASSHAFSGVHWWAGHGNWVVPSTDDLMATDQGLSGAPLNAFAESHSASSFDVTIDTGAMFEGGRWLGRDVTTTVTLASSTANQVVYAGWEKNSANTVYIGLDTDFPPGYEGRRAAIWEFDTDGSGVTAARRQTPIGEALEIQNRRYEGNGIKVDAARDADSAGAADNAHNFGNRSPTTAFRDVRTLSLGNATIPAGDHWQLQIRRPSASVSAKLLQVTCLDESNNSPTGLDAAVYAGDGTELYRETGEVSAGTPDNPLGGPWDRVYLEFHLENGTGSEINAAATFTVLLE